MDVEKITSFIQSLDKKKKSLEEKQQQLDTEKKQLSEFLTEISQISDLLTINSSVDFVSKEEFESKEAKVLYNGKYCKVSLNRNQYKVFIAD